MSLYVQITDFTGQAKVATDIYSSSELQDYLDQYEVEILQELLGCTLYEAFEANWNAVPTGQPTGKFLEIWDSFCIDGECGIQHRSIGIKKMLVLFIYFLYLRDQKPKNNIAGPKKNKQANSEDARFRETNIITNYNQAVSTYWAIQWLICDNPNDHDWDDYNGQGKEKMGVV